MELMLEHGIRADRAAAERLVAARSLRRLSLTALRQRVEVLRMYGQQLSSVTTVVLTRGIKSNLVPRLEFVAVYACASRGYNAIRSQNHSFRPSSFVVVCAGRHDRYTVHCAM